MNEKTPTDLTGQEAPKEEEFLISEKLSDFPVTECPAYSKESIGAVCIAGTATIQAFDDRFKIVPGMVITLLPWQLVSIKNISGDFHMTFFRIALPLFTDTLSGLCRLRPGFFSYMRRHLTSQPDKGNIQRFLKYCDLLAYWNENSPQNCRRETIMQFLRTYYWTLYALYINDPSEKKTRYTHKEEIAFKFMHYIIEDHSPDKDVAYYAKKLGLSPKSLTNLTRNLSGQSARSWIVYYTIFEIKALLRDSSMDIKSIAARTHFPDHATLSRYFRRYTGLSPSEYRESIHF